MGCGVNGVCVPACQSADDNKSTIGCEYYSMAPDVIPMLRARVAAFIANTWSTPISINVERAGVQLLFEEFARIPTGQGQSLTYAPLAGECSNPTRSRSCFCRGSGIR